MMRTPNRRLFSTLACALAVLGVSCGGGGSRSTPTQPAPVTVPPPPPPTAGTLSGAVIDLATGAPVEGATVTFKLPGGDLAVASGSGGAWEMSQPQFSLPAIPVEIAAPGFVTRQTFVSWAPGSRDAILIDIIRDSHPFSLTYYRELVRDLFSAKDDPPQPLRRWTTTPNFYVHAVDPRTGAALRQVEIDMLVATIRASVPPLTGGQFGAGEIEIGFTDRPPQPGVIKVHFIHDPDAGVCGRAYVGANPGEIEINYGVSGCGARCGAFAPWMVAHEVGHAMGFFHVAEGTVMNTVWFDSRCERIEFSDAERHHAGVAYRRLPGNRDPDVDPETARLLQNGAGPPVQISCR